MLLIATVLVDPHLYAYDLILVLPALLLLWAWVKTEPARALGEVFPRLRGTRLGTQSFTTWFSGLLYFCYLSPALVTAADLVHVQLSVPAAFLLVCVAAWRLRRHGHTVTSSLISGAEACIYVPLDGL